MSEPNNSPLAEALTEILEPIVRKAVKEAMNGYKGDPLLTSEELAKKLNVPSTWVYEQSRM